MSRMSSDFQKPGRPKKGKNAKKIFISCEGSVTEEEYFNIIKELYHNIRAKIEFVSVREEILKIPEDKRTQEQKDALNNSSPEQLVENIDEFKSNPKNRKIYDFDNHPNDEFWVIADVDKHTQSSHIQNWVSMMQKCRSKGYGLAVSNPFFELWLLLHHDDVNDDLSDENNDVKWAVTDNHPYQSTNHFRKRLSALGVGLISEKHIVPEHYNKENVMRAIGRSVQLDVPPCIDIPINS